MKTATKNKGNTAWTACSLLVLKAKATTKFPTTPIPKEAAKSTIVINPKIWGSNDQFWHIEFLTDEELQITTFDEFGSLYTRNISYYTNGDDFYVLSDESPFNWYGQTTTPNKILLLDNEI